MLDGIHSRVLLSTFDSSDKEEKGIRNEHLASS